MKRITVLLFLQCFVLLTTNAQIKPIKVNTVDAQQRKQGEWEEQMPEVRGEPGYTWEGTYIDNLKEGVWKKYALSGGIIAEETFKHGVLHGHSRYFYSDGKVSAEGSFVAVDIDGQIDHFRIIDPITGEERFEEVKRTGSSLRNGVWKVYDEDGRMSKEYYKRGEPVSPEELDTLSPRPAPKAPVAPSALPHQQQKKKG